MFSHYMEEMKLCAHLDEGMHTFKNLHVYIRLIFITITSKQEGHLKTK